MNFKYSNKFIKQELKSNKQRKMSSNNISSDQTEYTFVDLYKNGNVVGLPFVISGDKFLETTRCGDPTIRNCDDFECTLWGFQLWGFHQENDSVKTLVFINEETEQMLHVSNRDGKIFTSGFVKGYFVNVEMQDNFKVFQQY